MKLPAKIAVWLLPLCLAGCVHKGEQVQVQPLAPPIEDAPPPKPAPAAKDLPPPVVTVPQENPAPAPVTTTAPVEEPKPHKHKKPAAAAPAPPPAPTQQAATDSTTAVSAIGQLSSGDPSDLRKQTVDTITSTEKGLNGITRNLSDQEQTTATQIREFLKQAREALTTGDVDGAHTLASKAKVLLSELTR